MTMLLAIDTSTRYAGVALADEERVVASRTWHSGVNHTAELLPAVAQLLQDRGLTVRDLAAVAVALGPGGFSALRVGISVGKGLCLAGGFPILGVGSLDLEAFPFVGSGLPVCALLESGRTEAASALFGANGQRLRDDRVSTAPELLEEIGQPTLFCGEGVARWVQEIKGGLGSKAVICSPAPAVRVWSLAAIARQRLDAGKVDDLATLQPQYLRMPSIGSPKQRDRAPQESSSRSRRNRT
jgi:tRNA threonylcarbamoyladenosine biosynthesis protein TsaB